MKEKNDENKKLKKNHPEVSLLRISHFLHKIKENTLLITTRKRETLKQVQGGPNYMTTLFNCTAFTLIELLVVVLIIGILAAVAVPQYEKTVFKSRFATLTALVKNLAEAEEIYYLANGEYTDNFEKLGTLPSGCSLSNNKKECNYSWGSCALNTAYDDAVSCVNQSSLNNGYAQYFRNGKYRSWGHACWSFSLEQQNKYSKLCESVGATYTTLGGCPPYGECLIYRFR